MKKSVISIILSLFFFTNLYSARPLSTDDAGIVEKNKYEFEFGYNNLKFYDNSTEQGIDYSIKYRIAERVDFGFAFSEEIPYTSQFSPLEISIKFLFLEGKKFLPDIASTIASVVGASEYALNFIFTKEVGIFVLHLNSGISILPYNGENTSNFSFALEYMIGKRINFVSEICTETSDFFKQKEPINCLIGANYGFSEWGSVDIGFFTDINGFEIKYAYTTGFTLSF